VSPGRADASAAFNVAICCLPTERLRRKFTDTKPTCRRRYRLRAYDSYETLAI
jgi:hypothetical protein